ncbi:MAG: hypothetical protein CL874_02155 [Dehalococcoidales bacterium]|nr:hypothetical protein [Dehalococcoidales bacterium]
MQVLNPRGKLLQKVTRKATSRRLNDLNGKKIGILNNTFPGGEVLWPYIEEALKKRIPNIELRSWIVPHRYPSERKEPQIRELTEFSDAVIASMAG